MNNPKKQLRKDIDDFFDKVTNEELEEILNEPSIKIYQECKEEFLDDIKERNDMVNFKKRLKQWRDKQEPTHPAVQAEMDETEILFPKSNEEKEALKNKRIEDLEFLFNKLEMIMGNDAASFTQVIEKLEKRIEVLEDVKRKR